MLVFRARRRTGALAVCKQASDVHTFLVTLAPFLEPLFPPPPAVGFFCM